MRQIHNFNGTLVFSFDFFLISAMPYCGRQQWIIHKQYIDNNEQQIDNNEQCINNIDNT